MNVSKAPRVDQTLVRKDRIVACCPPEINRTTPRIHCGQPAASSSNRLQYGRIKSAYLTMRRHKMHTPPHPIFNYQRTTLSSPIATTIISVKDSGQVKF